jgi:hypothetical protein
MTKRIKSILSDAQMSTQREVTVTCHPDVISIKIEGLGKWYEPNGDVVNIVIEDGTPRLVFWPDINTWVAQGADLGGAEESKRTTRRKWGLFRRG